MSPVELEVCIPGRQDEIRASGFPTGSCQLFLHMPAADLVSAIPRLLPAPEGVLAIILNRFADKPPKSVRLLSTVNDAEVYRCMNAAEIEEVATVNAERILFIPCNDDVDIERALRDAGKPWWKLHSASTEGAVAVCLREDDLLLMLGSDDEGLEAVGVRGAILRAARTVIDMLHPGESRE